MNNVQCARNVLTQTSVETDALKDYYNLFYFLKLNIL